MVLEDFHIRAGSGGKGRWHGGRRHAPHHPVPASRWTARSCPGHRRVRPFGLAGGEPGELGENVVRRRDGSEERYPGCCQVRIEAGDTVIIRTPTGGGYGLRGTQG